MSHITVITPVFNCKNSIKQTILSVVAQSYDDWDMIIIDDVSTDDTGIFCQDFSNTVSSG